MDPKEFAFPESADPEVWEGSDYDEPEDDWAENSD